MSAANAPAEPLARPPQPGGGVGLSLVIPAYNEERRLPVAVRLITGYLDATQLAAEVVIVENGSDDRTAILADDAARADPRFRALHTIGRGKGLAVRTGMLAARGDTVAFCDVDFSMPIEEIALLQQAIARGADVAIASREAPGARRIGEPSHRHLMGRGFNWLVRLLALPGIQDTQCGFKAFRRAVAQDLFRRQVLDGWAFDVEVLVIARQRGYAICEVPVTWHYDPSSRVRPLHDTMAMIRELLAIRRNATSGRYS